MIRSGMCSVTLRHLGSAEVARVTALGGLQAIEWGADVHAPADDRTAVEAARRATDEHGLVVSSYGSYFKAGEHAVDAFPAVAAAAVALGAPRVRIWPGTQGSRTADAASRSAVVAGARQVADIAADSGLDIAFEYHENSLTDTAASTLLLLEEVDRPNVSTYWQAPVGMATDEALHEFAAVQHHVSAVHVFSCWPMREPHPLTHRADLWQPVFAMLRAQDRSIDALLEFVPDVQTLSVVEEAASLRRLAAGAAEG